MSILMRNLDNFHKISSLQTHSPLIYNQTIFDYITGEHRHDSMIESIVYPKLSMYVLDQTHETHSRAPAGKGAPIDVYFCSILYFKLKNAF